MSVDPTGQDLKRYLEEDPGGPVVMLNLLEYKDGGADSYAEYARKIKPFLERVGGEIVYIGSTDTPLVTPDDWHWDTVLLVRYPSRAAFGEMVADPEYQTITGLRTQALDAAVLQATTPWQGPQATAQ
jgi:uncharacterized protein (DUF1330 family)